MISQTKSGYLLGSIDSLWLRSVTGAEEMRLMITPVALNVCETDNDNIKVNDQLMGRCQDIQTLGATLLHNILASKLDIVVHTLQLGDCIVLLGATWEGTVWIHEVKISIQSLDVMTREQQHKFW